MGGKSERDRKQAVQRFLQGEKPGSICTSLGYSRVWFYKWMKRYRKGDPEWYAERSRRPAENPNRTQEEIVEIIKFVRQSLYNTGLFHGPQAIFITWAKYADKWVYDIAEDALDQSVKVFYAIRKPENVRYVEVKRTMNKYGKIRAIVIQSGKQKRWAAIYTNAKAEEVNAERVVRLMCRR